MLSVIFIITVTLTNELVMATDGQCADDYQFKSPFLPGESCEAIYNKNTETRDKPGYYWILTRDYCGMTYTGSSCEDIYNKYPETVGKSGYYRIYDNQWTYCDMTEKVSTNTTPTPIPSPTLNPTTPSPSPDPDYIPTCAGVGGGWKRIVNINISTGDNCPSGWHRATYSGVSFCRVVRDEYGTCSSTTFSINGTSYQRVCGRARGYQKGWSVGFWAYHNHNQGLDGYYVDGLSITHGNPRQHIWTFANGLFDNATNGYNCPCAGGTLAPPPFVGTNYYCESGATDTRNDSAYYFNDPLWDGSGCITSNCCDNPTLPWFYQELNGTTTDDIEARICRETGFSTGSTLIDQLELYIQ